MNPETFWAPLGEPQAPQPTPAERWRTRAEAAERERDEAREELQIVRATKSPSAGILDDWTRRCAQAERQLDEARAELADEHTLAEEREEHIQAAGRTISRLLAERNAEQTRRQKAERELEELTDASAFLSAVAGALGDPGVEGLALVTLAAATAKRAAEADACYEKRRQAETALDQARAELVQNQSRWESGLRSIVTILRGPCAEFEIVDIVEEVRKLHAESGPEQLEKALALRAEAERRTQAWLDAKYGKQQPTEGGARG